MDSAATRSFSATLALFLISFLFPVFVSAQFSVPQGVGQVSLLVNPQFPTPHGTTEVSLNDYSVSTVGATVSWYVDGALEPSFTNERTIRLTAGGLGETKNVRVVLSRNGTTAFEANTSIIPTQVDLIIEADTYVPTFYRGRALPSPESRARAVAVVNDGTGAPASAYTYQWSENSTVLLGGPVKGKNVLDLTVSRFEGKTISVTVVNADGITVGKSRLELTPAEPRLLFYEQSPLRGLLERAVTRPLPLISDEITVYGEPYFLHMPASADRADFSWDIGGSPVNAVSGAPNAITLRRVGSGGEAEVNLRIVTGERIPQVVEGSFRTFFE